MTLPALFLVTDAAQASTRARGVVETVVRALTTAAPDVAVVVRARAATEDELRTLCGALLPAVRRASARILVHAPVHTHAVLVGELGLDGVHLTSTAEAAAARALLPAGAWLGASRHSLVEDFHALDYATISPVFAPTSKPDDTRAPLGLEGLRAACAAAPVPLVALGGITEENAALCRTAGACAVAVLGTVMGSHDPHAALSALRRAVTRG